MKNDNGQSRTDQVVAVLNRADIDPVVKSALVALFGVKDMEVEVLGKNSELLDRLSVAVESLQTAVIELLKRVGELEAPRAARDYSN